MSGIKTVFGGATIQTGRAFGTVDGLQQALKVLKDNGIDTVDTAQIYGESETLLGEANAGSSFIIDTKAGGGFRGNASKESIIQAAKESKEKLGIKQVCSLSIDPP